ncbi:MAG: TlpA disulfide reductase family protein [Planctomycetota bacterium]
MRRPLRLLSVLLAALALTGCESGMFDDFDGLQPPSFGKRKDARRKPPKETAKTDPAVPGWEPVGSEGARSPQDPSPQDPPPASGWEPVDGAPPPPPPAMPPAPPPVLPPAPPPGTYQPPVPTAKGGTVALPPGHQAAGTSATDPLYGSYVGTTPPALGTDGKWLVPGLAPTLEGMRGQVVFLMFAFQTCPSCAQMTPYLKQWHDMYGPQGLSIVYVNNGRMATEADATKAIRDQGLRFAYLHDTEGSSLHAFSIRAFPTAYVIDRSGKVVWEGTPLAVEAQVQELLVGLLATK